MNRKEFGAEYNRQMRRLFGRPQGEAAIDEHFKDLLGVEEYLGPGKLNISRDPVNPGKVAVKFEVSIGPRSAAAAAQTPPL